jgi:Cu+-exporting ATPase
LATPLAVTVSLGNITQKGILVRNPTTLETASKVQRIVLDKTGTLTLGKLQVEAIVADPHGGVTSQELLGAAAAADQFSQHPFAQAIISKYQGDLSPAEDFQSVHGRGVQALVGGERGTVVKVGSESYLAVPGESPLRAEAQERGARGESVIWVGWEGKVKGFISLRDQPDETAGEALGELKDLGIATTLLSGDSQETTRAIAEEFSLDEYQGGLLPTEKAERIRAWQENGEQVAMVGDGVNDAPALAQSDLSVTVAGGTAVAGETSDIVLMRPDLGLIPWFIRASQRTRRIIGENLGWAFAYNLVAVPLAVLGIISPVIAAAAMACSSLLVVGNSLRLRRS